MVAERRGGYCLEHVTLFAAVLDALGFALRCGCAASATRPRSTRTARRRT